jgi:hypothetical protein
MQKQGNKRTKAPPHDAAYADMPEATYLRSYRIEPCVSCNACAASAQRIKHAASAETLLPESAYAPFSACPLTNRDDSSPLLSLLAGAAGLCIASPVYYYHLPAALKALIDRTQPFWALRDAGITPYSEKKPRTCYAILLAARSRGDRLFEGSLLTLKYALRPLNIQLAEPLLLYGLDAPFALSGMPEAMRAVVAYGEEAGKARLQPCGGKDVAANPCGALQA